MVRFVNYCPGLRSGTENPSHVWAIIMLPIASASVQPIPPCRVCIRCGRQENL